MSLFTLIKYPVDKDTCDFSHLPDDIWNAYMDKRKTITYQERQDERGTNAIIIKIMLEWEDPES